MSGLRRIRHIWISEYLLCPPRGGWGGEDAVIRLQTWGEATLCNLSSVECLHPTVYSVFTPRLLWSQTSGVGSLCSSRPGRGGGAGRGGAPGVRNSLACRLQHHHSVTRGGHPLMLSIQRQTETLVRRNHEIFKAMKGFIRGCVRLDCTSNQAQALRITSSCPGDHWRCWHWTQQHRAGGCWVLSAANAAICCAAGAQKTNSSGHNLRSAGLEPWRYTVGLSRVTQPRLVLVTTSKHCDIADCSCSAGIISYPIQVLDK